MLTRLPKALGLTIKLKEASVIYLVHYFNSKPALD